MYESLIVMLSGIIVYGVVYQFYVKWFDKNVIQTDPTRQTPAHMFMDGVEFFPSNRYVMLGWHWKSIAALGPVTGPALAIIWGWLPGFLWILIGNSLMGWLHDYNAMVSSVRNEGASLGPMTYQLIGSRARKVLVWFLGFYTILIFAAFLGALAPILINKSATTGAYAFGGPAALVSFFIMSLVGIGAGFAVFKAKVNVLVVTAISLALVAASIYLVQVVAGASINAAFNAAIPDPLTQQDVVLGAMLLFSFLGAILPLWAFAMPINYLGFYVAYFVIAGILGSSFVVPQTFQAPAFTTWAAPLVLGAGQGAFLFSFPLWPLMFVTIACGACSGWHGLIGSSLSSKQLDNESDAHFVGGGSMLLEGILGLTAVVAVAALPTSLWQGKIYSSLGLYVTGGARYLGNIGLSGSFGIAIMSLMVLVLGLTLTQLALRFARLAISEMVGIRAFKNIYLTSIVASVLTYFLTSSRVTPSGMWGFIWLKSASRWRDPSRDDALADKAEEADYLHGASRYLYDRDNGGRPGLHGLRHLHHRVHRRRGEGVRNNNNLQRPDRERCRRSDRHNPDDTRPRASHRRFQGVQTPEGGSSRRTTTDRDAPDSRADDGRCRRRTESC